MLRIKRLEKKYGRLFALRNFSLFIEEGKIAVIIGPNGAGKSTLFKAVSGLINYTGDIEIAGFNNKSLDAKRLISYSPENPSVYNLLTVREHLIYTSKVYKTDAADEEIDQLLQRYHLRDKQDKMGHELSKGMSQKTALCCAFIAKPKLMILDEPMVGLDPPAIKQLKTHLRELAAGGVTVLISTHMLDMVEDIYDHMVLINQGNLIKEYYKDEASPKLDDVFFEYMEESPAAESQAAESQAEECQAEESQASGNQAEKMLTKKSKGSAANE